MTQLTIFKVKPEISSVDDIAELPRGAWSEGIRLDSETIGILHVSRSRPRPPAWIEFFPMVDFSGRTVTTATASACLLVRRPSGYYAVVFGYGRYMLREGVTDERFGLRVALNATDLTKLRSLAHKRLESVPRDTKEQLSKDGRLSQFGLDIERDLLRGLTAAPTDSSLGSRMTGTDSLAVTGSFALDDLPRLLDQYAALSEATNYRATFPWVDNIAQVRDTRLTNELDLAAVDCLKKGTGAFWLAVPVLINWEQVAGFKYRPSKLAELRDSLDLETYYSDCGGAAELTVGRLKTDIVRCIRADDGADAFRWTIHRCLVGELVLRGEEYVLSEGEWYRVAHDFLQEVEDAFERIIKPPDGLASFRGGGESAYCKRAARKSKGELYVLDQKLVNYGNHQTVEGCDLYARSRVFFHVKKYGASAVLSHLFAQGAVSADLFFNDPSFRSAVSEKLPAAYRWGDPSVPPKPQEFEVSYVVLYEKGEALRLPFFSKVNLKKESRRLQQLGYKVSLVRVTA